MVESLRECAAWAEAGFPGASLKQLIQIAQNTRLEEQAVAIRQRAERKSESWPECGSDGSLHRS